MTKKQARTLSFGLLAGAALLIGPWSASEVLAYDKTNPEWPCVQRKVEVLTSAQMWEGKPVDDITDWLNDDDIRTLARSLTVRRIPLADADTAIKAFAAKFNGKERNEKLTLLFAGALSITNDERKTVIHGIERFQDRQNARARELERQGVEVGKQHTGASAQIVPDRPLTPEEQKYNWDARVFQERQQNIPLACEIPELIGQRIYEIAKLIHAQMSEEAPAQQ